MNARGRSAHVQRGNENLQVLEVIDGLVVRQALLRCPGDDHLEDERRASEARVYSSKKAFGPAS